MFRIFLTGASAILLVAATWAQESASSAEPRSHVVKPKDSLWSLSRKYNVTIDSIKVANNLKTDVIVDGRKLTIPAVTEETILRKPKKVEEPAKPEPPKPRIIKKKKTVEKPVEPAPTPTPAPVAEPAPAPTPEPTASQPELEKPVPPAPAPAPEPAVVPPPPVVEPVTPAVPPKPPLSYETFKGQPAPKEVDPNLQLDPKARVIKVHSFEYDGTEKSYGNNKALEFEKQYWTHGAITEAEKKAKIGNYFVITWTGGDKGANLTARLEYRQTRSKDVVRTLNLSYPKASGSNRSVFTVVGDAYRVYGPVSNWHFTLLRGDKIIAEEKSFIW
jgi:LysM repeat protein